VADKVTAGLLGVEVKEDVRLCMALALGVEKGEGVEDALGVDCPAGEREGREVKVGESEGEAEPLGLAAEEALTDTEVVGMAVTDSVPAPEALSERLALPLLLCVTDTVKVMPVGMVEEDTVGVPPGAPALGELVMV